MTNPTPIRDLIDSAELAGALLDAPRGTTITRRIFTADGSHFDCAATKDADGRLSVSAAGQSIQVDRQVTRRETTARAICAAIETVAPR